MSDDGTGATDSDDDLVSDWRRIRTATATVQRQLDAAVEAEGVPAQWFAVLHVLLLAPDHGLPMTVLARDLDMTSGGFTKLVDRMAKDGLVDRRGVAGDRRVVHAALTEPGREAAHRAQRAYLDALRRLLLIDHVPRADLAAASGTLDALGRAHADPAELESTALADPALLTTQRDPALPERRGRGRVSD